MADVLTGTDLINIAIGIERSGITFYDIMAKSTDNGMARNVFEALVEMERGHLDVFQDMLERAAEYQTDTRASPEHTAYIRALIDDAVFTDELAMSEMAIRADSDIKALELGISAEKDSILFYCGVKDVLPQPAIPVLDRIIAEEKTHLKQLTDIKKKLSETS